MQTRHVHLLLLLSLVILSSLIQCGGRESNVQELEWPPALSAAVEKAPTVPYCELIKSPTRFTNGIVRTEALFYKNLENTVFYDPTCKGNSTWVEFDPAYLYTDDALKNKFEELGCLRRQRCDGKARVTAVGRFEGPNEDGYGHLGCCPYRFSIIRIENADAVDSSTSQP